jgi:hypothetical protein
MSGRYYRDEFLKHFEPQNNEEDLDIASLTRTLGTVNLPRYSEEQLTQFEQECEQRYRFHVSRFRKITVTLPRLDFELLLETIFEKIRRGFPCEATVQELVQRYLNSTPQEYHCQIQRAPGWKIFVAIAGANFSYNFGYCKTSQDVIDELQSSNKRLLYYDHS